MLLLEEAEAAGKQFDIKIFATDTQDFNLNVARSGIYPDASAASLSPNRQRRFFDRLDGVLEVCPELRGKVIFSPHNLLRDPPFSRMDLVSCRNLMIYLQPEAQKRVVALAHFALRPDGHLFLGSAETVGSAGELFDTVSKKWRIYRRIGATRHDIVDFPVFPGPPRGGTGARRRRATTTLRSPASRTRRGALCWRAMRRRRFWSIDRGARSISTARRGPISRPPRASRRATSWRWRATGCAPSCDERCARLSTKTPSKASPSGLDGTARSGWST